MRLEVTEPGEGKALRNLKRVSNFGFLTKAPGWWFKHCDGDWVAG